MMKNGLLLSKSSSASRKPLRLSQKNILNSRVAISPHRANTHSHLYNNRCLGGVEKLLISISPIGLACGPVTATTRVQIPAEALSSSILTSEASFFSSKKFSPTSNILATEGSFRLKNQSSSTSQRASALCRSPEGLLYQKRLNDNHKSNAISVKRGLVL